MLKTAHIIEKYALLNWQQRLGGALASLLIIHSLAYILHIKNEKHTCSELTKQNEILSQEITVLTRKLEQESNLSNILASHKQKLAKHKAILFSKNTNELLNFIAQLAKSSGLKTNSIKPLAIIENKIYHTAPILIVGTATFQQIISFFQSLNEQTISISVPQFSITSSHKKNQPLNIRMLLHINTQTN